jgi:hypothetical protein
MERAHAFIALGGDKENTVPKIVTPPEVEVLRRIHSDDAVHDIEVIGDDPGVSKQAELGRLGYEYSQARNEDGVPHLKAMYPSHTLLPSTFSELGLPDEFYKATARAVPPRKQVVQTEQTHATPGSEPRDMSRHIPAGEFEPIEVPADPETQPEFAGRMVDPRTQHQNDEPPGVAINATEDGDAGKLRERAEEQGTGPGSVPTQTGARVASGNEADGGPVGTGSKTREQQHAEVTPKEQPAESNLFA